MKIFLFSGNNIERAEEMRDAILSSGGLPSVNVTVSGDRYVPPIMLEGVSAVSSKEYTDEGLIWRAYTIGPVKSKGISTPHK